MCIIVNRTRRIDSIGWTKKEELLIAVNTSERAFFIRKEDVVDHERENERKDLQKVVHNI